MSYILYIYIYKYPGSWRLRLQPNTLAPGGSGFETLPVLVCSTVNVNLTLFCRQHRSCTAGSSGTPTVLSRHINRTANAQRPAEKRPGGKRREI